MEFPKDIKDRITEAVPATNNKTAEPKDVKSIEIDLGEKKDIQPESKTINFKSSDFLKDHINKKTSDAKIPEKPKSPEVKSITTEPVEDKKLQPVNEDYEMVAGFIIDMFDLGTATLFRYYAMDTTDAPYEMTKSKKTKLALILGKMLEKMNKKFPLSILFVITLILALLTPAQKARSNRKLVLNQQRKKRAIMDKTSKTKKPETKKPETKKSETKASTSPTKPKTIKRPRGGVSK